MTKKTAGKACPCTSGRAYAACCRPFHRGEREAETPVSLMRSRFAAFAVGDAEYLWRTLHAEHEDRALAKDQVVAALRSTSSSLRFMRLTIVDAKDTQVLFLAAVFEKGQDRSFVELSTFGHDGTGWRYLGGNASPALDAKKVASLTIETFLSGPSSID